MRSRVAAGPAGEGARERAPMSPGSPRAGRVWAVTDSAAGPATRRAAGGWGYASAAWSGLFAVRGVYWALGGTVGLSTLAPTIQDAAVEGDPLLYALLWTTVALEIVGVLLGLALARGRVPALRGRDLTDWLLLPAFGAAAMLAGHGALFIVWGLTSKPSEQVPADTLAWYGRFWGPWFLLGGLLFLAPAVVHLRRRRGRRAAALASALGAAGGLLVAAAAAVS